MFGDALQNGVGVGIGNIPSLTSLPYSQQLRLAVASLFAGGAQGYWFDNSRLDTIFQDAAGTTPGALEAPVGKQLDLSGRGNHRSQSTSANRPTLSALYNRLVATTTLSTQSITTAAGGYTLRFSGTGSVTLSGTATGTFTAGVNTFTATAGTLTLTVSGQVLTADCRPTDQATGLIPQYQRVDTVSAGGYDTVGFPYYLKPTAPNQGLSIPSVDLSATSQMTLFMGIRKTSDAASGIVVENGTSAWTVFAPGGAAQNYQTTVGTAYTTLTTYASPITKTLSYQVDTTKGTVAAQIVATVNGAAPTTSTPGGTVTSGTLGNQAINFFTRSGTAPFSGNEYGSILVGAIVTAGQLAAVNSYMAQLSKAY